MAGHSKNDAFVKNLEDEGLFALIGDNIGSHYSEEVIKVLC